MGPRKKTGGRNDTNSNGGLPSIATNGTPDDAIDGHGDGDGVPEINQDPHIRRRIRHDYRHIMENLKEQKEELINPSNNLLQVKLERTDEIFKEVKMTREAALDSMALVYISDLGKQKAQALQADGNFIPVEFASKLVQFLSGQTLDADNNVDDVHVLPKSWVDLGKAVQPFFKRSPALSYMYGTFETSEPIVKLKKERKRRVDDGSKNAKESRPEKISSHTALEKREETTEAVEKIMKILNEVYIKCERSPICFIEFVTNPWSFGQTVENIFHVSFLIRDGHARVTFDDDRLPVIEPVEKRPGAEEEPANQRRHQAMLSITKPEWKQMVRTFEITDSILPHRGPRRADDSEEEGEEEVEVKEEEEEQPSTSTQKRPKPGPKSRTRNN